MDAYLKTALNARKQLLDEKHVGAVRLFNGPIEGNPELIVDLYAKTLVLFDYRKDVSEPSLVLDAAKAFYLEALPWLQTVVVKQRNGATESDRWGRVVYGEKPDTYITEHGVRYSIDLLMNQDGSLYLDTRELRRWALDNLAGKSVLNTFAYTGSLGVAACAAGASRVVHTDLSKRFMNVAKTSYSLNGFPIARKDFVTGDFFSVIKQMTRADERFDCVFLDPPFFSAHKGSGFGTEHDAVRLINKVRPLVNHGGVIIAVNNALFLSGGDYMAALEGISDDGYVTVEETIPIPVDFTGTPETRVAEFPTSPEPFNHPTKIAVLRISRKEGA